MADEKACRGDKHPLHDRPMTDDCMGLLGALKLIVLMLLAEHLLAVIEGRAAVVVPLRRA